MISNKSNAYKKFGTVNFRKFSKKSIGNPIAKEFYCKKLIAISIVYRIQKVNCILLNDNKLTNNNNKIILITYNYNIINYNNDQIKLSLCRLL